MQWQSGRYEVQAMDHEACVERLRSTDIGRVAAVVEDHPVMSPVVYAMADDLIVFRITRGKMLDTALRGGPVAFEVDDIDLEVGAGWSVVVTGWARVATTPAQAEHFATLPLPTWVPDKTDQWIVVHPERFTGRRLVALEDPAES